MPITFESLLTPAAFAMIFIARDLQPSDRDALRDFLTDDDADHFIDLAIDDSRDNSLADDFSTINPALAALLAPLDTDDRFISLRELADAMTDDDFTAAHEMIMTAILALIADA
jgi:hypothetical protein